MCLSPSPRRGFQQSRTGDKKTNENEIVSVIVAKGKRRAEATFADQASHFIPPALEKALVSKLLRVALCGGVTRANASPVNRDRHRQLTRTRGTSIQASMAVFPHCIASFSTVQTSTALAHRLH